MRDETGEWLAPLLDELRKDLDADPQRLGFIGDYIERASMPAREAMTPSADAMVRLTEGSQVKAGAIDWVRFGQLIIADLGWTDYPDYPTDSANGKGD